MQNTKKVWSMPPELERYRQYINNTGGNSVEKLMNLPSGIARTNKILAALSISVDSQLTLLQTLRKAGELS